jgi:serine kinase of HPr protein (carbohydrate metabolism regulator)
MATGGEFLVHATCVWAAGRGLLLRGGPGAGKSDLALRLIEAGAMLVADDQVALRPASGRLLARPPASLAGLIEVRGIGLLRLPYRRGTTVDLLIDLVPADEVVRLPEPAHEVVAGVRVPRYRLEPFAASAVAKIGLLGRELSCLAPEGQAGDERMM